MHSEIVFRLFATANDLIFANMYIDAVLSTKTRILSQYYNIFRVVGV